MRSRGMGGREARDEVMVIGSENTTDTVDEGTNGDDTRCDAVVQTRSH